MRVQCGNCGTRADYVESAGVCAGCGRQLSLLSGPDRVLDGSTAAAAHRTRNRLVGWVCGGCVLGLVVLVAYADGRGWTPGKVERAVNRDLPPGATRSRIEADLDAKGWPHIHSAGADSLRYYGEYVGLRREQLGGIVFADVPGANVGWLNQGSVTVFFYLGPDDRLIRSYVRVALVSF
jgi:hypothetical protein